MIARCRECGEAIYDGDTAYKLGGRYYCTSCVDDSLTVARRDDYFDDDGYDDDNYEDEG